MRYEPKDFSLNVRIGRTERGIVDELIESHGSEGEVVRRALRAYCRALGLPIPCEAPV
jgi:hypothetical protein